MNTRSGFDRIAADAAVRALAQEITGWWGLSSAQRSERTGSQGRADLDLKPLFDELMRTLNMNWQDFADHIGFDKQTIHRWLTNESIPRMNVVKRLELVPAEVAARVERQTGIQHVTAPEGPAFLTAKNIVDREKYATHLWIFKWNRRFLTVDDPQLRPALHDLLMSVKNGCETAPIRHYVFPSDAVMQEMDDKFNRLSRDQDYAAEMSYEDLDTAMNNWFGEEDSKILRKYVHGDHLDRLDQVLTLGIPRFDAGLFMIEYNEEGVRLFKRTVDVFLEIETLTYSNRYAQGGRSTSSIIQPFWIEYSDKAANRIRLQWRSVLKEICPTLRGVGSAGDGK